MHVTDQPMRGNVLRGHAWYYDWMVRLLTLRHRRSYVAELLDRAHVGPGDRQLLDVGCGTGSLALAAAERVGGEAEVIGLDASEEMLDRARRKAARAGRARVRFVLGTAEALPFESARFDVVFSTLMLHHLPKPARIGLLREAGRVLKPGGRLLVADFEVSTARGKGFLARLHRHGGVPVEQVHRMLADAGFAVTETGSLGVSSLHYTLATPCVP